MYSNKIFRPINNDNILLRGQCLKIAPVIYGIVLFFILIHLYIFLISVLIGCALYTGKNTKMMLNSKFKANKLSCVER